MNYIMSTSHSSSSSGSSTTTKDKKEKSKEKKNKEMKTLQKRSLKKWLTKSKNKRIIFDVNAVFGEGTDDSNSLKSGLENKDQISKLHDSDDSDSDDEDDDIDDEKLDSMIKIQDSHPLTPKEIGDMHIKRMKESFQIEIQFKSMEEVLEIAQEDHTHIIFIIHCVDWFNLSRLTIENFKNVLAKEKDVLYFFVDQSSPDYIKESPMDLAGIPLTKIFYKQNPIKIQRNGLEYDWGLDDKIRGLLSTTQIKTILEECRECKHTIDSDLNSYNSDNPPPLEIKLEF